MKVPKPDGPDVDRGTNIFIGCWFLTTFVFLVLTFRYVVKIWMAWLLPKGTRPTRVWGWEDFFFAFGFAFDITHMAMIWKSHEWGLGRHFFYLSPVQKATAMKWDFISQPFAVAAAMWSRTGVILFLCESFAENRRRQWIIVIICFVVQLIANLFTILQIFLQCGPHPYRLVNRAAYFHYMWDLLPSNGSVVCQAPSVQATVGYVQGAFNTLVDFTLTYLAGFEIWQFILRVDSNGQHFSLFKRFKRLEEHTRNQRLWATALLCGPLLLSGVASIVKTYLLSALGSRSDFTWNIVEFVLWVKIGNYCIPLAATAPTLRLFIRTMVNRRGGTKGYGMSSSDVRPSEVGQAVELTSRSKNRSHIHRLDKGFVHIPEIEEVNDPDQNGSLHGSENELVGNVIMVKKEYDIRVENGRDKNFSKARSMPYHGKAV